MINGYVGEQKFAEMVNGIVIDLTHDERFYDKDIDFIVYAEGEPQTWEVKWDSKISMYGNLFIEFQNTACYCGMGWYEFCKAQYIAYGDAKTEQFHCFNFQELRELIDSRNFPIGRSNNKEGLAVGYLVPLAEVKRLPSYHTIGKQC